jgi:hypothetical protein
MLIQYLSHEISRLGIRATPKIHVVCDIEIEPGMKPIAQKARRIPSHQLPELLKELLQNGIIELSNSKWASPIVIVMKKNGVDMYRLSPSKSVD